MMCICFISHTENRMAEQYHRFIISILTDLSHKSNSNNMQLTLPTCTTENDKGNLILIKKSDFLI